MCCLYCTVHHVKCVYCTNHHVKCVYCTVHHVLYHCTVHHVQPCDVCTVHYALCVLYFHSILPVCQLCQLYQPQMSGQYLGISSQLTLSCMGLCPGLRCNLLTCVYMCMYCSVLSGNGGTLTHSVSHCVARRIRQTQDCT